jgi:D-lactate dehydrogenase (quinone)
MAPSPLALSFLDSNPAGIARRNRIFDRRIFSKFSSFDDASKSSSKAVQLATHSSKQASQNRALVAAITASLATGFMCGRSSVPQKDPNAPQHVLPNGLPRTCCDHDPSSDKKQQQPLTEEQRSLPRRLEQIVGAANVLDGRQRSTKTLPFLQGARIGGHDDTTCLCIITPTRLQDVVDCVELIVNANCVIVPQGRNTGLTGGSVPRSDHDSGRPVVVLSTKHLDRIFPIDNGHRVVCLAGVGLSSLQQFLATFFPYRESHSVLGSSFLNPTTAAGVAFGSGGTQCRKGPAYTERALYLKVTTNKWQENVVEVINTLGIEKLTDEIKVSDPERARKMDTIASRLDTWSRWIQNGYARDMRYSTQTGTGQQPASDVTYAQRLCNHQPGISRYNANVSGPDYNRSEGKVIILATVHDTFPKPLATKTLWLSFDSLETALAFRQQVCLDNAQDLPISVEYLDRDAFDVIDEAGRIMGHVIALLGVNSKILPRLWSAKQWAEALPIRNAPLLVDQWMYTLNRWVPRLLPGRMYESGRTWNHHVAMTVGEFGQGEMSRVLDRLQHFASSQGPDKIAIYECQSKSEVDRITAFRFIAAPAFRTWCVGNNVQGISVDYALPKHKGQAPSIAPTEASDASAVPLKRMRYSHFACNVVHEDLAYAPGVDVDEAKHALKHVVEYECHGKLPAEHGHGTEYEAPPETKRRWQRMDPLNVLNPGVGGTSTKFKYVE